LTAAFVAGYPKEVMGGSRDDTVVEYNRYLERFDTRLGTVELGSYAKHNGRLIKKLSFDEFESRWLELAEVDRAYSDIVANGDTINDVLVRVLRERCDELLIERRI
jgi:hypothetical protein